ncbi:MAG: hypothetical protein ISS56_15860 [Anaerolineae bacterium]|nr:hypothetical protein [Anaerolineae bacterium]
MKRLVSCMLLGVILLTACGAPKTVIVTQEVTRVVEVTQVVKEDPASKPAPTFTRYPTYTPYPTHTLFPTPTNTATTTPTMGPTSTPTVTPTPSAMPTEMSTQAPTRPPVTPAPVVPPTPAMTQIKDTDPGPPFTIVVSANRSGENSTYKVTGTMFNHSSKMYEAVGMNATFYDDQNFRHGPLDVNVPFQLLAPGEETPFSIEIAARRVQSFLLHPEGRATGRESAPVTLSNVSLSYAGTDSVRISGLAANPNAFMIKNVAVAGVLLDGSGQIVSLGSTYVLQEDITQNSSVAFDLRIPRVPFLRYQLYAQSERDWE